jgi:predicted DNA-binding transcriptional regulator AlpA
MYCLEEDKMPLDHLYSTPEAASYCGLSRSFLNKLRCTGGGPRYVKLGRRVVYTKPDLDSWTEEHRRSSTSDQERALAP